MKLDATHDPAARSWVESANAPGCDFPIQNLPFGIFRKKGEKAAPRGGVAIGDQVLDLAAVGEKTGPSLNGLAAAGRKKWVALRREIFSVLAAGKEKKSLQKHLTPLNKAELFVPVEVGDYTDFFTSLYHATNTGRMFRPDNPLLPNYKWVPIGYHGRASSIVASGTPVKRPSGQVKPQDQEKPSFGPSRRLDYEAELGFVIGPGNALGKSIAIGKAEDHIFGVLLLNDWSARDVQGWEYQPLGPFLAKSFATTVSPWIVTLEALAPFRAPAFRREASDPAPLPYLFDERDQAQGHLDIQVEMWRARGKEAPQRLSRASYASCYWTPAQLVAHHSSNGCNLRPGDLLGSGTISGPTPDSVGSLLEMKSGFLEDGDTITERGRCERQGYRAIGFGEAAGTVVKSK